MAPDRVGQIDHGARAIDRGESRDAFAFWAAIVDGVNVSAAESAARRGVELPEEPRPNLGPVFALVLDAIGSEGAIEILDKAIARIDRAETMGPIVDPSAWRGNRFERSALVREVLQAARELARAEIQRRSRWGS